MRAVTVQSLDGPDGVQVGELPDPRSSAAAGDLDSMVLIDVHAAGMTFPDLLASQGRYQLKPPLPFVLGSQLSGTVRSVPAGSDLAVGDRVCAFTMFGAQAEQVAVGADQVFVLPARLSFAEGAAVLTNHLTALFTLRTRGRLVAGETVLVHGAAGGVGLATVDIATALGARVIAVVSSSAKADAAREAGASDVVAVDGFRDAVQQRTDGRGVDIIVDPVGGDRFTDSLRSLAQGGRLLVVGFTGGDIPSVRVNRLLLNNIEVIGAAWGEWALTNPGFLQRQWAELSPLLAAGTVRPRIGATLRMDDAANGLRILERREAVGNIVLQIGAPAD